MTSKNIRFVFLMLVIFCLNAFSNERCPSASDVFKNYLKLVGELPNELVRGFIDDDDVERNVVDFSGFAFELVQIKYGKTSGYIFRQRIPFASSPKYLVNHDLTCCYEFRSLKGQIGQVIVLGRRK